MTQQPHRASPSAPPKGAGPSADAFLELTPDAPAAQLGLSPGQVVAGRYRLEERLGRGGFGEVFVAHQLEMNRKVAVKLLHGDSDAQRRARFVLEAQIGGRLRHPNLINVFDCGRDEALGRDYLAMDLLEGRTLGRELADKGRLALERCLRLFADCLHGLGEAHSQDPQIIHRDLKPANLFLTWLAGQERLVILDFGIARAGEVTLGTGDGVLGTASYLPPEALSLDRLVITPAYDVYSMGLILYEALVGERLVPRGLPATAQMVMHQSEEPWPVPESLRPAALRETLRTALAKDPQERFSNAVAFRASLLRAAADLGKRWATPVPRGEPELGKGSSTDPTTLPRRQPPASSKRPWLRGAAIGSAALAFLAFGAFLYLLVGPHSQRPSSELARSPEPSRSEPEGGDRERLQLRILSSPGGAIVQRGERPLGVTPLTLQLAPDAAPQLLTLRLEGYEPANTLVGPADTPQKVVQLTRRVRSAAEASAEKGPAAAPRASTPASAKRSPRPRSRKASVRSAAPAAPVAPRKPPKPRRSMSILD